MSTFLIDWVILMDFRILSLISGKGLHFFQINKVMLLPTVD